MRLFFSLAFLAVAWLTPARGAACGGIGSGITLVTDAMGKVPAGTKVLKLYVYGTAIDPSSSKLILSVKAGGMPVTVPVTLRVVTLSVAEVDLGSGAIQEGVDYTLTVSGAPNVAASSTQLSFVGGQANPMPSQLGRLVLDKRASGKMSIGICPQSVHGEHVLIKLAASAAAAPWTRTVKHQLFVDGKASFEPEIPLVDPVARKLDLVIHAYARCTPVADAAELPFELGIELPVEAGEHSVKWASTFPDGTTLETPAVAVDLRCSGAASVPTPPCCKPLVGPQDGGAALPSDAGVNIATPVDMGPSGNPEPTGAGPTAPAYADSGAAPAAVPQAAVAAPDGGPAEDGCNLGRGQRGGAQALGLFVFLFLLHARQPRRRA